MRRFVSGPELPYQPNEQEDPHLSTNASNISELQLPCGPMQDHHLLDALAPQEAPFRQSGGTLFARGPQVCAEFTQPDDDGFVTVTALRSRHPGAVDGFTDDLWSEVLQDPLQVALVQRETPGCNRTGGCHCAERLEGAY